MALGVVPSRWSISVDPTVRKFLLFHNKNIHVYERFVDLSFKLQAAGFKKYSSRTIIAVLRFEWDVNTSGQSVELVNGSHLHVKLNNDHAAFYSRLFMENYPAFKGFYNKRRSVAD